MYGRMDPVLFGQAGLGIFEVLYQVALVLDATRRKNIVQIAGVCLDNASMLVFVAIVLPDLRATNRLVDRPGQRRRWHHLMQAYESMAGVLASTTLLMAVVAWLGFREFEW